MNCVKKFLTLASAIDWLIGTILSLAPCTNNNSFPVNRLWDQLSNIKALESSTLQCHSGLRLRRLGSCSKNLDFLGSVLLLLDLKQGFPPFSLCWPSQCKCGQLPMKFVWWIVVLIDDHKKIQFCFDLKNYQPRYLQSNIGEVSTPQWRSLPRSLKSVEIGGFPWKGKLSNVMTSHALPISKHKRSQKSTIVGSYNGHPCWVQERVSRENFSKQDPLRLDMLR